MKDIGVRNGPIWSLRFCMSRFLIDFQHDLEALEHDGLEDAECDDVKEMLRQAIGEFKKLQREKDPTCPYTQLTKHLKKYADLYEKWNGHKGKDKNLAALRKRELTALKYQRRKLFGKLARRGPEIAADLGQLELPMDQFGLTRAVHLPMKSVAEKHSHRFPRLKQATVAFRV